jgi:thymidylate synthase (FAD)
MEIEYRDSPTVELVGVHASDIEVAHAAWVSTLGERSDEGDPNRVPGLINYLMKDRHGSPFEHGMFKFRISCPIFVVREFHRHRAGWSYNEHSGRYSELAPIFYLPNTERKLTQTGKPGHYVFSAGSEFQQQMVSRRIRRASVHSWEQYQEMLAAGIAKEVARMILPLNIFTTFYATCNPRSLMHFLSLRTEVEGSTYPSHPQFEIQQVAAGMEEAFKNNMPITYEAWNRNGRVAP